MINASFMLGTNKMIYNNNKNNINNNYDTEMMVLVPLAVTKTLNYQFCNWTYVKEKSTSQVFHPLPLSPLLSGKKQTLLLAIIAYIIPRPVVFFYWSSNTSVFCEKYDSIKMVYLQKKPPPPTTTKQLTHDAHNGYRLKLYLHVHTGQVWPSLRASNPWGSARVSGLQL